MIPNRPALNHLKPVHSAGLNTFIHAFSHGSICCIMALNSVSIEKDQITVKMTMRRRIIEKRKENSAR